MPLLLSHLSPRNCDADDLSSRQRAELKFLYMVIILLALLFAIGFLASGDAQNPGRTKARFAGERSFQDGSRSIASDTRRDPLESRNLREKQVYFPVSVQEIPSTEL